MQSGVLIRQILRIWTKEKLQFTGVKYVKNTIPPYMAGEKTFHHFNHVLT